jgi:hypothetical protein
MQHQLVSTCRAAVSAIDPVLSWQHAGAGNSMLAHELTVD